MSTLMIRNIKPDQT